MIRPVHFRLLLSESTRRKFALGVVGSVVAALTDALGVLAILPLMQLLTGQDSDSGLLGWIRGALGHPSEKNLAIVLAIFTFGAFTIKGVLAVSFKWWLLGVTSQQEAETSARLLRYFLSAPFSLHVKRNSADLLRVLNDAVRNVYTQQTVVGLINIIAETATLVAIAAILVALTPVPALLLLLYFAIAGGVLYLFVRPLTARAGQQMLESYAAIYQGALHALGGVKEIQIRHKVDFFLDSYRRARMQYANSQRTASFFGELPRYLMEIIFIFGIGLLTIFIFSTSPSAESIGVLAILAAAGFRLLPSAVRLLSALNIVRFGQPSYDLVVSELNAAREFERTGRGTSAPPSQPLGLDFRDRLRFESVSFRHEGQSELAVDAVSFELPFGSSLAFVGASGAGKTTLVDLLLGLHQPDAGRITVDGTEIAQVLPEWHRHLGLVPQEVYLLDSTLRENIAFGERHDEIDEGRLAAAIRGAQLDDFVAALPMGLETQVGERGVRLSGGQRQRIGIARALYPAPQLLVLDEATSALDNETERRIAETIGQLHGKVSVVMVAHRLSTVRECDQIVFLHDGKVAATGTFSELEAQNAEFARLVELGRLG